MVISLSSKYGIIRVEEKRYPIKWALVLSWFTTILAFGFTGYLLGWLTGSSNSPVVATVLPLVFGLVGAFSYSILDKSTKAEEWLEKLHDLELDSGVQTKVSDALRLSRGDPTSRALWSSGVAIFCACAFLGTLQGVEARNPKRPTTSELLSHVDVDLSDVTPTEFAVCTNNHFRLIAQNVPPPQVEAVFRNCIGITFQQDNAAYEKLAGGTNAHARAKALSALFEDIFYNLERTSQASESSGQPPQGPIYYGGGAGTAGPG